MFHFRPIGRIVSAGAYRFEAPRQPVFAGRGAFLAWEEPELMRRAAEDLEGFERIWIIFVFDRNPVGRWKPKVRPPLSPDGKRYSVLATRSPHRPNPVGLSAVTLLAVRPDGLELGAADLLDGTPVLDVKPYIAEADAFPRSRAGWRDRPMPPEYQVAFRPEVMPAIRLIRDSGGPDLENFCRIQLCHNPGDRRRKRLVPPAPPFPFWQLGCRTWRVFFARDDDTHTVTICGVGSGYRAEELAPDAPDPYSDKMLHRLFLRKFPTGGIS